MGWRSLLAIVLSFLFLLACSPASDSAPDSGGATTEDSSPETAASPSSSPNSSPNSSNEPSGFSSENSPAQPEAGSAKQGGKLIRLFRDPPTLDPHLTTDSDSSNIIVEIFGGLVTIDPELNIVPDLAESWDISPDGRVYTFHLRRDAKFHDGKPVTAEDVRWSLERVTDPATQAPVVDQYLGDIVGVKSKLAEESPTVSGIRVLDDHTLEITIDAAKSYFLAKLTYPTAFVLDRDNVEADPKNWLRHPNGTGPFKLTEYEIGETMRLTRNASYHLGAPYLAEVEFILSGGSSMIMYENDEIHLTGVGLADLERVQDPSSPLNAELHRPPPDFSISYIGLNVNEPPLDDPKVRRALNLAINRPSIADSVLENLLIPAKGIIPPGFPSHNPNQPGYKFDPEGARRLLLESKYGADLDNMPPIILTVPGSFGASVGLDLEVILAAWEELGIFVDIQQTEWATFLQDLHRGRFQMFQSGWIADYPDPENFLDLLFHSESDNNHTNYSNPRVDTLLEKARVEPDQTARFQIYNEVEQIILQDAPWVLLWNEGEGFVLIKSNLKGYHLSPLVIPKLRYVYFSED